MSDPISNKIFGDSYETPTLHVIGKTDIVVIEERSRALLSVSRSVRLEEHAGGLYLVRIGAIKLIFIRTFCAVAHQVASFLERLST